MSKTVEKCHEMLIYIYFISSVLLQNIPGVTYQIAFMTH